MDTCLNTAVDQMIEGALHLGTGILVTRLADEHFVVGLSEAVPFGYTEQLDCRHRATDGLRDVVSPRSSVEAGTFL